MPIKYKMILNKYPRYSRILEQFRTLFNSAQEQDFLVVPYVLMCAATLEARLNDEIGNQIYSTFREQCPGIMAGYTKMGFSHKLDTIVPLLTENAYVFNRHHIIYKRLQSLIKLRNKLIHPKTTECDVEYSDTECKNLWPFRIPPTPQKFVEELDDLTLGATFQYTPIEYHEALEKLEKWFFLRCPNRLSKVALVEPRRQEDPPVATYIKKIDPI